MHNKTTICNGCGEPFTYNDTYGNRQTPNECGTCGAPERKYGV